ncbi:hypothetical protein F0562_015191 [Nyssa sinensis]|uniref:PPM-type phosphatase domain-containing protein n=1 Tax=Nyssa sinensis TaxID=561372 RepID=A0A5J4ZKA3_9ASTE|nr:hypothetical protein F0562_015191 [Nyssa sinensis]
MGTCCSKGDHKFEGFMVNFEDDEKGSEVDGENYIRSGDRGARSQGSSKFVSMFTQQGRKGINQDAMTVWENFTGEKDMFFCGVYDGHGLSGHKVARYVRDILPSKLSSSFKHSQTNGCNGSDDIDEENKINNDNFDSRDGNDNCNCHNPFFSSWKASLIKSFEEMDEELSADSTVDSYCSGTTAVAILKQGNHLVTANLGDSRAILCTRGNNNKLISVQLTVDMKPNLPVEAERIKNCRGRVFALDEEPEVFRVWMPDQNCPGLAMARAFGDFCLKDFGLISIPDVSYRKLTDRDEFVVLATDGVWDVLTNNEVIKIVASARKRSMAARLLVDRAVQAWKSKYPCSKIDDCAVVCLFLKHRSSLTKSMSEVSRHSMNNSRSRSQDGLTVINGDIKSVSKQSSVIKGKSKADSKEWTGVTPANSFVKLPQVVNGLNQRRPAAKGF